MYIDSYHIEISPLKCNTRNIRTYNNSNFKFAMSATFENDLELLHNLDFSLESILNPVEPKSRKDYGQRLILSPQRYFNNFDNDVLITIINHHLQNHQNVLVIVPSYSDADLWATFGAKKIVENVELELENLKNSKGNFIVITNRYDGIDLSGDACNVLILYNHPNYKFLSDRYYETMLNINSRNIIAQTIEQGMGRTVRSGSDFSVVYLLGRDMLRFLRQKDNFDYLNKHTKRQIEIGLDLLKQETEVEKNKISEIICETADYCLNQNDDWLEFYQNQMNDIDEKVDESKKEEKFEIKDLERQALIEFINGNYENAVEKVDEILKKELTDNEKAKYYLLSANINYYIDKNLSNNLLIKAKRLSFAAFQPFLSKDYLKSLIKSKAQIKGALDYLKSFTTMNDAINSIREAISFLVYSPQNSPDKFEEAVKELGLILGYNSLRPEKEQKQGSDNLWIMDNNTCLVIEAKSEKKIENLINKDNISQLLHSLNWFDEKYIHTDSVVYGVTMQYNDKKETTVTVNSQIKVINNSSLELIKVSLNKYIDFLSQKKDINSITENDINTEFKVYGFITPDFLGKYLKSIK